MTRLLYHLAAHLCLSLLSVAGAGEPIQTLLDTEQTHGKIELEQGIIPTKPLVWQNRAGGVMEGHGSCSQVNNAQRGACSVLLRSLEAYDPNKPSMTLRGYGRALRDFSIFGDTHTGAQKTKPNVGVQIAWDKGTGSGWHSLENITVYKHKVAFQSANNVADSNCEHTTWRTCKSLDCDVVFRSQGDMSMGHEFDGLKAVFGQFIERDPNGRGIPYTKAEPGKGIIFDMRAGGKFTAENVFTPNPGTVLMIERPGPNNGVHTIDSFEADSQTGTGLRLLHVSDKLVTPSQQWFVTFNQPQLSANGYEKAGAHLYYLKGCGRLDVIGGWGTERKSIVWDTSEMPPNLKLHVRFLHHQFSELDGWRVISQVLHPELSKGPIYVSNAGSTDGSGNGIPMAMFEQHVGTKTDQPVVLKKAG